MIENSKAKTEVLVLNDNDIVDYVGADDLYDDDLEDYALARHSFPDCDE